MAPNRNQTLVQGKPPCAESKSRSSTSHGRGTGDPKNATSLVKTSREIVTESKPERSPTNAGFTLLRKVIPKSLKTV